MQPPKPFREERPGGEELWFMRDIVAPSMVKLITVMPDEALSLQFHHNRDEFWHVISGDGEAAIGEMMIRLHTGIDCFIPKGTKHRITGGTVPLVFLELAYGDFDEADIVRLDDLYGRVK
jgi:mannose-1-phosphate guanylyltransferase/mannose-1-phosphate guanylyltransferase/mannose-6-phosphate isomerase